MPDSERQEPLIDARQRTALISWAGFTATFATTRAITHAIKRRTGGNVEVSGVHVHHYLWGIALLAGAGGVAVHGSDDARLHPAVAAAYGAGGALVVDEFALLIHLKDVYWARRGRWSVILAVILIGATGASFAIVPGIRRRAAPAPGDVDKTRLRDENGPST